MKDWDQKNKNWASIVFLQKKAPNGALLAINLLLVLAACSISQWQVDCI